MPTLIDSYSESNYSASIQLYDNSVTRAGQSFQNANSIVLSSCKFYLQKGGSASGDVIAEIYAHSGTFGSNSVPTGSPLATSDAIAATSLPASFGLVEFTFSGANKITLSASTYYVVIVKYLGPSSISIGRDSSSPAHAGNQTTYYFSWNYNASYDICFYVYGEVAATTHIKSFNGCLQANIKNVNGLAIANVKNINGLE